jgi:hypothetical protein
MFGHGRIALLLLSAVAAIAPMTAHADYDVPFVRVACIPEARLLDIEFRPMHNGNVAGTPKQVWPKHGFYDPTRLDLKCTLPQSSYRIVTSQEHPEYGHCVAYPEVRFSLLRNGATLVRDIVLGESCPAGAPSITRLTIQEAVPGYTDTEAEVCVRYGADGAQSRCDWVFGGENFKFVFSPLDTERLDELAPQDFWSSSGKK